MYIGILKALLLQFETMQNNQIDIIEITAKFFDYPILTIIGAVVTIIMIVGFIYTICLFAKGVIPVLYRIGNGLSKRKIAIFAEQEYGSLSDMIIDSKNFTNTIQIHKNDIKKAERETVFLVHWGEYEDKIDEILDIKKDSTPLIIYAPQCVGTIDKYNLEKINMERNSVVVMFRGRL